jgi:3-oxoacyl-[acyl-carrier protein] reductase
MPSLTGKVALITGASRGIGRAIAERLAHDGATVVVNYLHNADKAAQVVATITAAGGQAIAVQADVGQLVDIRRLFAETIQRCKRLDVFVNNAAIAVFKPILETTPEEFDAVFDVNAKGAFFALQEAARHMQEGGRIIYISSAATAMALSPLALYSASKAAMETSMRVLAREIAGRGITVNIVSPGYTDTDMLPADPEWRASGARAAAFGRLGQPKDIADVVGMIASPDAGWLTGQKIEAGGGLVI